MDHPRYCVTCVECGERPVEPPSVIYCAGCTPRPARDDRGPNGECPHCGQVSCVCECVPGSSDVGGV